MILFLITGHDGNYIIVCKLLYLFWSTLLFNTYNFAYIILCNICLALISYLKMYHFVFIFLVLALSSFHWTYFSGTWPLTWQIRSSFVYSSDSTVFASLLSFVLLLTQAFFFSWTEKFRDQDACKTALDGESLRQCRKKMTARQRTVELVSLCVWMCARVYVRKCQTRQCDPRAWFLPTTTQWQLLKWLFFSCCGLSALEGRKQSLIRPECCHKVCMRPNACCLRTHTLPVLFTKKVR